MSRQLWAKSPQVHRTTGELLTTHLATALAAMDVLQRRVGKVTALPEPERFWIWARLAILLHDAGKVADGFQIMVGNSDRPAETWGERHEILSLGFVARVLAGAEEDDRLWVATGVATHHRPFTADGQTKLPLFVCYPPEPDQFVECFGTIDPGEVSELQDWLITTARNHGLLIGAGGPPDGGNGVGHDAYQLFEKLRDRWETPLHARDSPDGLTAVLLQGAVTLADHVSSAHGRLCNDHPLTAAYPERLRVRLREHHAELRPHQIRAATVDGHLLLRAPTGSGKTEAALLWALTQIEDLRRRINGTPRLFYVLPYLASINAMANRLGTELDTTDIGVAHSRAASYHLDRAVQDDCVPQGAAAHKAVSRAAATRLFRELVRVGTPYQLLRGALAGPAHSGILIDAVNSVFILDELHAYDPRRLGMILAMLRLWEDLGGRIAVLSATLPEALADLLKTTLKVPCEPVALAGSWPERHRIMVRDTHLTDETATAEIAERLRAGQSVLVVANNVADARALYEELAPVVTDRKAALLLHSR
ncbi:MAG: CRISPR-associated helicase Cas3', partial [Pseudonocardiaceae bacterium]